jgi:hypothetical protein
VRRIVGRYRGRGTSGLFFGRVQERWVGEHGTCLSRIDEGWLAFPRLRISGGRFDISCNVLPDR